MPLLTALNRSKAIRWHSITTTPTWPHHHHHVTVRHKITAFGTSWRGFLIPKVDKDTLFVPIVLTKDNRLGSKGEVVLVHRVQARNEFVKEGTALFGTWENIDNFSTEGKQMWAERFRTMREDVRQREAPLPDVDEEVPRSEEEMSIENLVKKARARKSRSGGELSDETVDTLMSQMKVENEQRQLSESRDGTAHTERTSHRYRSLPSFLESSVSQGLRPLYDGVRTGREQQHNKGRRSPTDDQPQQGEIDSDLKRLLSMNVGKRREFFNEDLDETFGDWREECPSVYGWEESKLRDEGDGDTVNRYLRNVSSFGSVR